MGGYLWGFLFCVFGCGGSPAYFRIDENYPFSRDYSIDVLLSFSNTLEEQWSCRGIPSSSSSRNSAARPRRKGAKKQKEPKTTDGAQRSSSHDEKKNIDPPPGYANETPKCHGGGGGKSISYQVFVCTRVRFSFVGRICATGRQSRYRKVCRKDVVQSPSAQLSLFTLVPSRFSLGVAAIRHLRHC